MWALSMNWLPGRITVAALRVGLVRLLGQHRPHRRVTGALGRRP